MVRVKIRRGEENRLSGKKNGFNLQEYLKSEPWNLTKRGFISERIG